jgi:hypothetical protein
MYPFNLSIKKMACIFCLFLTIIYRGNAQEARSVLSGHVKDASTGEDLIGATVRIPGSNTGAVSNQYGYFSLNLPRTVHEVQVSYIGYEPQLLHVAMDQDRNVVVLLEPEGIAMETVVISAESSEVDRIQEIGMSVERVSISQLQKMPKLLGEVDLIRNITLMPGISTIGEGTSGFNVRGGGADENLILLDEAPVYNAAHVMGFFSVFNPDAIKDAKIYKGGLPAMYGGRLSSVLDVRQLDGNKNNFEAYGGIGNLSSRLAISGPIQKGRTSFLVAGRRSYLDQFARFSNNEDTRNSGIFFYDLNTKINHVISEKDKIYFSYYLGKDHMKLADMFKTQWGNSTTTFRWNHIFNPRLFSNLTVLGSKYDYKIGVYDGANAFEWKSNIGNQAVKYDVTFFITPETTLDFGIHSAKQEFEPGTVTPSGEESGINPMLMPKEKALESALYVSIDQKISEKLKVQAGLRLADFRRLGGVQYVYENDVFDREAIIDTLDFGRWGQMANFLRLEPRMNLSYQLDNQTVIKGSYHHTNQFVQLVSNTSSPSPIDIWKPANNYIQPSQVHQIALGMVKTSASKKYEFLLEGFYKNYNHINEFKNGAQLTFNRTLETEILKGIGRAYGMEVSAEKKQGRLTGRISYTLSKSERKVEGINQGNWYNANFDKPHDLSAFAIFELNKKWNFSANFVYATGRPLTMVVGRYEHHGRTFPIMGERNAHRIPDYHRLDISANLQPEGKKGTWSFGLYNAYSRRNPYSIFFRPNENGDGTEAVRLSILGSVMPSVTYNFKF